jgi:hypothetical protein
MLATVCKGMKFSPIRTPISLLLAADRNSASRNAETLERPILDINGAKILDGLIPGSDLDVIGSKGCINLTPKA